MKKALTISIRSTLFTIEEDAYVRLDEYLKDITGYFSKTEGSEEVIGDIETRIAEKLFETKEQVISLPSVESIILAMGTISQFEDAKNESAHKNTRYKKKLYRNPSDSMISGVSSGIAAYIGQEAIFVRLGFILLTLLSGFGILLYCILWILMPEAKTQAQKLEMAGEPVTLETISTAVKDQIKNAGSLDAKQAGSVIQKHIQSMIRGIGPTARIVTAVILILTGVTLISGSFTVLTFVASLSAGIPIHGLHILGMSSVLLSIIIPGVYILLSGIGIIRKKSAFSNTVGITMLIFWIVSICITLMVMARLAGGVIATSRTHYFPYSHHRIIQIRHW
jgi:phage shock protein PspC (stress-responsive transcriptional regulator)